MRDIVVKVPRFEDRQIIRKRQQAAVKHPMDSTGKCNSIPNPIISAALHWAYVRCRDLRPPMTINEPKSSEGTGPVVCNADVMTKFYVSPFSTRNQLDHRTAEFFIQDFWLRRFSKSFSYKAIINRFAF